MCICLQCHIRGEMMSYKMSSRDHKAAGKMHRTTNTPSTHMCSSKRSNSSGIFIKNSRSQPHPKHENSQHVILLRDQKPYQDKMQEGSIRSTNTCVRNKTFQHRTTEHKRVFRLIVKCASACFYFVIFPVFSGIYI